MGDSDPSSPVGTSMCENVASIEPEDVHRMMRIALDDVLALRAGPPPVVCSPMAGVSSQYCAPRDRCLLRRGPATVPE
jgi:hypothetical protein